MEFTITHLTVDLRNASDDVPPMHIGTPTPRFGWRLESAVPNLCQLAYRITVCQGECTV